MATHRGDNEESNISAFMGKITKDSLCGIFLYIGNLYYMGGGGGLGDF